MKTLIITIVALLALVSYPNYNGKWIEETESSLFSLTLTQKDSIVTGKHSSIMLYGNRIDDSGEEESIQGAIKNGELIVKIKSAYETGEPGTAKITFIGKDSIHFKLISQPSCENWIPNEAILIKSK